jgi:hypothetical protein
MTKQEAIDLVGKELVKRVNDMDCDFSGRQQANGSDEFVAHLSIPDGLDSQFLTISAYYYQDADAVKAAENLDDLKWSVHHYEVQ